MQEDIFADQTVLVFCQKSAQVCNELLFYKIKFKNFLLLQINAKVLTKVSQHADLLVLSIVKPFSEAENFVPLCVLQVFLVIFFFD